MGITNIGKPHFFIKCMEKRWIDEIYKKGNIRLSCPGKWVQYEIDNGIGRGDKYEGTFEIQTKDLRNCEKLKRKYGNNLIQRVGDNHTYYQLHTVLGCPTFCFYTIEDSDIQIQGEVLKEGIYEAEFLISGEFYQDFAKGKGISKEVIEKLPEDEQPAVLIIAEENIDIFLNKVRDALKTQYDLCDNNILIDRVKYEYDRQGQSDFLCLDNHPYELFYKNKELAYQNEARIVVNSKKYRYKQYNDDYLDIHLGSLKECSEVHTGYHPEGTKLKMQVQLSTIKSILKRDGKVTTGYNGKSIEVSE
ncbi:MAG: hypothetical protein PHT76_13620 [Anaerostipes sp.]|nr:hypothetical protein [Anaerostipes sp.]